MQGRISSFLWIVNSHKRSNCHLSLVNRHSTLLQWHSVHNLQGNIAVDLHQNGCICKLVAVLKEQHNPKKSSSIGNKSIRAIHPTLVAVKESIPWYVKSKEDLILIFYIRHGVMIISTDLQLGNYTSPLVCVGKWTVNFIYIAGYTFFSI